MADTAEQKPSPPSSKGAKEAAPKGISPWYALIFVWIAILVARDLLAPPDVKAPVATSANPASTQSALGNLDVSGVEAAPGSGKRRLAVDPGSFGATSGGPRVKIQFCTS